MYTIKASIFSFGSSGVIIMCFYDSLCGFYIVLIQYLVLRTLRPTESNRT